MMNAGQFNRRFLSMLIQNASWITMKNAVSTTVPVFRRRFSCGKPIRFATLEVTCDGVYEAVLNGRRVGSFILAPCWTRYTGRSVHAGSIRIRESGMRLTRRSRRRLFSAAGAGLLRREGTCSERMPGYPGNATKRGNQRTGT